jgi:hypothetical protein
VLGGIYAYWLTYIHPDSALGGVIADLMVVTAFLVGKSTFWGPLLGAVLTQLASRTLWLVWGESMPYLVIIGAAPSGKPGGPRRMALLGSSGSHCTELSCHREGGYHAPDQVRPGRVRPAEGLV